MNSKGGYMGGHEFDPRKLHQIITIPVFEKIYISDMQMVRVCQICVKNLKYMSYISYMI